MALLWRGMEVVLRRNYESGLPQERPSVLIRVVQGLGTRPGEPTVRRTMQPYFGRNARHVPILLEHGTAAMSPQIKGLRRWVGMRLPFCVLRR